jgi:hypothetical protein
MVANAHPTTPSDNSIAYILYFFIVSRMPPEAPA